MLSNNYLASFFTLILSVLWLRINDFAAHREWISNQLSRKIIHIGTGPLYVLCWLFFTNTPSARYLAAIVPFLITIQFVLVGFGIIKDEAAVQAMSRSGDRREILRGPLFYGIMFILLTLLYWKESPIGMIALMLMCGGDGLADILGRRYGTKKLPWSKTKSYIGSLGMFIGGWVFAFGIVAVYVASGVFPTALPSFLLPITIIAVGGTIIESLPLKDVDNLTITITAMILGHLFVP
jgi:phytol kinase